MGIRSERIVVTGNLNAQIRTRIIIMLLMSNLGLGFIKLFLYQCSEGLDVSHSLGLRV